MTDQEVLKKAIEKATRNGFTWDKPWSFEYPDYFALIYSHQFAKAFWGEKHYFLLDCGQEHDTQWEQHLIRMVLEENPIDYLRKFLEEKC